MAAKTAKIETVGFVLVGRTRVSEVQHKGVNF